MAASWECPSLPMLSFPMKDSAKTTFLGLKPLISAHYEEDPESFNEEIRQLNQLREHAMHPSRDYNGCSLMRRYYAQLHLLRARFPPESVGQIPVDFAWKDAHMGAEYIQEGLQIEQASLLYNISALHSQLGCNVRRETEQQMKEAITHFQCAAGAYTYLDERLAINHGSKDLSPEFVTLYKSLMLGQAQECLVEKSLKGLGRVKNLNVAKIATRVSEYYSQVARALESEPCSVVCKKNKDWPRLLRIKTLYFQGIAHFFQAAHSEELGRYGEALALEQLAQQKLASITKIPKSLGEVVRDAVRNFHIHVQEKLQVSRRQNDQVYHEAIPSADILEFLPGADLVKPVLFHPTDPKNLGADIFARLIPMRAHEAASIYSEEKAKLLRSVSSSVETKDNELEQFLRSLNAGEIDKLHERAPNIPGDVLQQQQALQGKRNEINKLHSDIRELMSLSEQVSEDLAAVTERKGEESREEEQFQAKFGGRPPSQVCTALWKDLDTYQGYHNQAMKSNSELKAMFDQHHHNLILLSGPPSSLIAAIPRLTLMDTPAENLTDSERWKELLGKIEKMKQQRRMLTMQLREQMDDNDITKLLIGHLGSDMEAFIDEQMKRHRDIADIVQQNLTAQDKILTAVTEANAKQVGMRQAAQELDKQQEAMFSSLVRSGSFLPLLQSKIKEGLQFYSRVHDNVLKLRKKATDVCNTRRRERQTFERQRTPTPEHFPPSPSPQESPGLAPPRPPKRAELSGKPIPPDQRKLPPATSERDASSEQLPQPPFSHPPSVPQPNLPPGETLPISQPPNVILPMSQPPGFPQSMSQPPSAPDSQLSLEQQLQEIQRTHQLQMEQLQHINLPASELPTSVPMQQPPMLGLGVHESITPVAPGIQPLPPAGEHIPVQTPQQLSALPSSTSETAPHSMYAELQPTPFIASTALPSQQDVTQLEQPGQWVNQVSEANLLHLNENTAPATTHSPSPGQESNQSLLELQMLLQPPTDSTDSDDHSSGLPEPLPSLRSPELETPERDERSVADMPLRPPKPMHLRSEPVRQTSPSPESQISHPGSQSSIPGSDTAPFQQIHHGVQKEAEPVPPFQPQLYKPMSPLGGHRAPVANAPVGEHSPYVVSLAPPPSEGTKEADLMHQGLTDPIIPSQDATTVPTLSATQTSFSTASSVAPVIPASQVGPPIIPQPEQNINIQPGESTITINSMSRPIPAIQSPPVSPDPSTQESAFPSQVAGVVTIGTLGMPQQYLVTAQIPQIVPSEHQLPPSDANIPASFVSQPIPTPQSLALPTAITQDSVTATASDRSAVASTTISTHISSSEPPLQHVAKSVPTSQLGVTPMAELAKSTPPTTDTLAPQQQSSSPPPSEATPLTATATGEELPRRGTVVPAVSPLHGLDSTIVSLQPLSSVGVFQTLGTPLSLPTALTLAPLQQELSTDLHSLQQQSNIAHLELLLSKQQETIHEQSQHVEEQNHQISHQKAQMEMFQQQILLLQQQISQLTLTQQKQEAEKASASGQQAMLMQLLQQQQGMFSQQQSRIEKLSQVGDVQRKEQLVAEVTYKQALAVGQEQKSALQNQAQQQTQEIQNLHQQLQAQAQQCQTLQLQLHQYHTQIQERDKQLVAFRDQHKQIVQTLEQKHQQKVSQLLQQLQAELKKAREQQPTQPQVLPTPLVRQSSQPGLPQQTLSFPPSSLQQPIQPSMPMSQPAHSGPMLQPSRVSPQPQFTQQALTRPLPPQQRSAYQPRPQAAGISQWQGGGRIQQQQQFPNMQFGGQQPQISMGQVQPTISRPLEQQQHLAGTRQHEQGQPPPMQAPAGQPYLQSTQQPSPGSAYAGPPQQPSPGTVYAGPPQQPSPGSAYAGPPQQPSPGSPYVGPQAGQPIRPGPRMTGPQHGPSQGPLPSQMPPQNAGNFQRPPQGGTFPYGQTQPFQTPPLPQQSGMRHMSPQPQTPVLGGPVQPNFVGVPQGLPMSNQPPRQ